MTKKEIIEMAKKCGWDNPATNMTPLYEFAKLIAEKERKECAAMSDWILKEGGGTWGDAIRARGQE
jgi:hypothetical protein